MPNHKDRVIIVTGAAGAIGFATAEILAAQGAKLMLVDISLLPSSRGMGLGSALLGDLIALSDSVTGCSAAA